MICVLSKVVRVVMSNIYDLLIWRIVVYKQVTKWYNTYEYIHTRRIALYCYFSDPTVEDAEEALLKFLVRAVGSLLK